MRTSPYGVHTDYIFGGLTAKRNRLREAQIWLDAPSYYSSPRLLQVQQPLAAGAILDSIARWDEIRVHLCQPHPADQEQRCCAGGHTCAGSARQF